MRASGQTSAHRFGCSRVGIGMPNELARPERSRAGEPASRAPQARGSVGASAALAGIVIVVGICWLIRDVLLVLATGILAAIALGSFTDWLMARGVARRGLALAVVMISIAVALSGTGWLLAPEISAQTDELVRQLPRAWDGLMDSLRRYEWGRSLVSPHPGEPLAVVSNATGVVTSALRAVGEFGIVIFIGVYLALDPEPYRRGLLRLVPREQRARTAEVLVVVGVALQRWLLSRLVAMVIVASATALGLWLLNVPLALTLGLLSGLLTFVPYLGAIVSAVPALLIALAQGWLQVLDVMLLYVAVHVVEGYMVTPLIEQQAVWLPPALSIAAQVILFTLAGVWGLALASPIAATALVAVNMLYIEDRLGETAAVPTESDSS
jgi:predicted PurR-regulated permease PerM